MLEAAAATTACSLGYDGLRGWNHRLERGVEGARVEIELVSRSNVPRKRHAGRRFIHTSRTAFLIAGTRFISSQALKPERPWEATP